MSILTFNATNTRDATEVVWWMEFDGIRKRYGSCTPSWNPSDTSTNRTILPYMDEFISVRPQSVEPLNGKTTSHNINFSLLDVDDALTSLMAVHNETDVAWTTVTSNCTAGMTTLTVSATSAFTTPCDIYVGSETMRATDKTATTFAVTRGMYSSTTVDHLITDDAGLTNTIEVWDAPRYFIGRGVTLRESRSDLDESDSIGLYGIINSVDESDGIWTFSAPGILSRVAGKLNRNPAWARTVQPPDSVTVISGGTGTFVAASATQPAKYPWVFYGDYGIMAYTDVSALGGAYPADARIMKMVAAPPLVPGRPMMKPIDQIPNDGVDVVQCCSHVLFRDGAIFYTDPLSVLLCLLLSKNGDKTNHATYDILPKGIGLGIESRFVAVEEIEALRKSTGIGNRNLQFVIKENEDAKKWIEENLLRPNLLFLVETWNGAASTLTGAITVKRLMTRNEAVIAGSSLDITEDVMLEMPEFEMRTLPIGEIKWQVNYDPVEEEYMGEIRILFAESVNRYRGAAQKYNLECQTIYDDRIGKNGRIWRASEYSSMPATLGQFISVIWDRFAVNQMPTLTVEVPYNRLSNCYPGNIVRVTSSTVPNVMTGARGMTNEYFQIVESAPDPKNSSLKLKLWLIGIHDVHTGRIAPSAKIHDIQDDYKSLGHSRVFIYKNAYAASTGYADYKFFTVGDKVKFYSANMVPSDSATYTVRATGTSVTYDWIELAEAEVDPPPAVQDGAVLDTAPYDSCTTTQHSNWAYLADTNDKLGAANDDGDQRL